MLERNLEEKIMFQEQDKFTLCAIGECGQGKSTFLTYVSKLFSKFFSESTKDVNLEFNASKSFETVT